jgi:hypothetical protein
MSSQVIRRKFGRSSAPANALAAVKTDIPEKLLNRKSRRVAVFAELIEESPMSGLQAECGAATAQHNTMALGQEPTHRFETRPSVTTYGVAGSNPAPAMFFQDASDGCGAEVEFLSGMSSVAGISLRIILPISPVSQR